MRVHRAPGNLAAPSGAPSSSKLLQRISSRSSWRGRRNHRAHADRLTFHCITVAQQDVPDGRFPTVKSPNRNVEALSMAVNLANETGADFVIATDPDRDRMGIAARDHTGKNRPFSPAIRLARSWLGTRHAALREGILTENHKAHTVVIKTLPTTDLQKAIAEKHRIRWLRPLPGTRTSAQSCTDPRMRFLPCPEKLYGTVRRGYAQTEAPILLALRFRWRESYGYSGSICPRQGRQ